MGNTFSLLHNKVNYLLYDPEAEKMAKAKADEEAANKAAEKADADAAATVKEKADAAEAKKKADDAAAAELSARSKFSSPSGFLKKLSSQSLIVIYVLLVVVLFIFGGKLAANDAIGWSRPMRVVSFLYGGIMNSIITVFTGIPVPIMFIIELIRIYYFKMPYRDYSILPVMEYAPTSMMENLFIGWLCYTPDEASMKAKQDVAESYRAAFMHSRVKPGEVVASQGQPPVIKAAEPSPKPEIPKQESALLQTHTDIKAPIPGLTTSSTPASPKPLTPMPSSPKPTSPAPASPTPAIPAAASPKPLTPKLPVSPKALHKPLVGGTEFSFF